ncbi:MAG: TetR/AcrR family transcriptional regulator [Bacteriovoracaceae bacterium]|nr:TetR/AcrR family transcriptional regulator [Bacteriovoracaceae bacterium]
MLVPDNSSIPKKKRIIVNTATKLFYRFGMKRITVEEICQKAGVSKATFYKYFPNKVELIKYIFKLSSKNLMHKLEELKTCDMPFYKKINSWIEYKVEITSHINAEFVEEFYQASEELADFTKHTTKQNYDQFLSFIVEGQSSGDVRQDLDSKTILALIEYLGNFPKSKQAKALGKSFNELTEEVNKLFYFGILTDKS